MNDTDLSFFNVISTAGLWAIPILAVFAYTIIEVIKRSKKLSLENSLSVNEITQNIEAYINQNNWEKAISLCAKYDVAICRILRTALLAAFQKKTAIEIKNDVETQTQYELPILFESLNYISALNKGMLLLGFLASLFNMVSCFYQLFSASAWERTKLIKTAYLSSSSTLIFAIFLYLILFLLHAWLDKTAQIVVNKVRMSSSKTLKIIDMYVEKLR